MTKSGGVVGTLVSCAAIQKVFSMPGALAERNPIKFTKGKCKVLLIRRVKHKNIHQPSVWKVAWQKRTWGPGRQVDSKSPMCSCIKESFYQGQHCQKIERDDSSPLLARNI